jgi:hypothetical protein
VKRALVLVCALLSPGCEGLFAPYCDEIGVYPTCTRHAGAYTCPTSGAICNDDGYRVHYSCKDYGGTFCTVRQ